MTTPPFTLREMEPADSLAVRDLISEGGGVVTTYFKVDAFQAIVELAEFQTVGVVAEAAGAEGNGLAGLATVRFGRCQFNGRELPFAFLDNLKVAEGYRQQGLGRRLAAWRVARARETWGDEVVLLSGTISSNTASIQTMKKWAHEFVDDTAGRIWRPLSRRPEPPAGVAIREAEPGEYEELADRQNRYYRDYNLYPPVAAADLALLPAGPAVRRHFVAAARDGRLLAGLSISDPGALKVEKVNPPFLLGAAARLLRLLPADHVIRTVSIRGLWFADGREALARPLVDHVRFAAGGPGTLFNFGCDPRSPLARLLVRRRLLPLPRPIFAVRGPEPLEPDRLRYIFHP